jgi:hypothetical protein
MIGNSCTVASSGSERSQRYDSIVNAVTADEKRPAYVAIQELSLDRKLIGEGKKKLTNTASKVSISSFHPRHISLSNFCT